METVSGSNAANESPDGRGLLQAGTMVSHYRVIENIGSGGMGDVYLADDTKLARRVALKFLSRQIASDPSLRARFTREVQAVAALNHPNIVHVYEVSEYNGIPFCAMEYVEGRSLREVIRDNILEFEEITRLAIEIASGLEAAHNLGIVHRDVKPANIILDRNGRVRILDFGLAKRATDPDLTIVGSTLGTVNYMSPEQAQGKESDRRSDIFSYGIVLYQLITRKLPFKGAFDAATLTAIVHDNPPTLSQHRNDTPQGFQKIVSRILEKNAEKRYQSMADVITDLTQLQQDIRLGRADSKPERSGARKAAIWGGIAVIVLINGVVAYNLLDSLPGSKRNHSEEPHQTEQQAVAPVEPQMDSSEFLAAAMPDSADNARLTMTDTVIVVDTQQALATRLAEERAQSLQDSLNRMYQAMQQAKQPETGASQSTKTEPARTDQASAPIASLDQTAERTSDIPQTQEPDVQQGMDIQRRAADSSKIIGAINEFWVGLEKRNMSDLKRAYPSMSKQDSKRWEDFIKMADDLRVRPDVRNFRIDTNEAVGTVAVNLSYRDSKGTQSLDLRYDMKLQKASEDHWTIVGVDLR